MITYRLDDAISCIHFCFFSVLCTTYSKPVCLNFLSSFYGMFVTFILPTFFCLVFAPTYGFWILLAWIGFPSVTWSCLFWSRSFYIWLYYQTSLSLSSSIFYCRSALACWRSLHSLTSILFLAAFSDVNLLKALTSWFVFATLLAACIAHSLSN